MIVDQALQRADARLGDERLRLATLGLVNQLMDDASVDGHRRIVLDLVDGDWEVHVETPVS